MDRRNDCTLVIVLRDGRHLSRIQLDKIRIGSAGTEPRFADYVHDILEIFLDQSYLSGVNCLSWLLSELEAGILHHCRY